MSPKMFRRSAVFAWLVLSALSAPARPADQKAEAVQIKSFAELLASLQSGQRVRAVFRYKLMSLTVEGKPEPNVPDAVGGMPVETFEYFAAGSVGNKEGYLAFSETRLIRHPRHGYVLNYVKVSVFESGEVRILAQYLDPKAYDVKMDETFVTVLNDGSNKGGAFFFLPSAVVSSGIPRGLISRS